MPGKRGGPMEIFDEIYNCYYTVVRQILTEAASHPITRSQMEEAAQTYGYGESSFTIIPRLVSGEWPLLTSEDGKQFIPLTKAVLLPLTNLQKSWLKSLLEDERILLFLTEEELACAASWLADTKPLYLNREFHYFDRYLDGDNYASPSYRKIFRTILNALEQNSTLLITYKRKQGDTVCFEVFPYQLQFSGKDDKFRLCCLKSTGKRFSTNTILNLNRIESCHLTGHSIEKNREKYCFRPVMRAPGPVLLEISGERNSLERCMLHFANYEKHTRYDEERGIYLCSIYYDLADETELLIDILSFGPVIRVLGPDSFLAQIRRRVRRQHELLYERID